MRLSAARRLALLGAPADRIDDLEQRLILRTSISFARRVPREWGWDGYLKFQRRPEPMLEWFAKHLE